MSEKRGRKRHIVQGEVSQVRRSNSGLGRTTRVGEGGFMSAMRRILRSNRNEEKK